MPNTIPRGRFVWHELLTSDPDRATNFYTKLIGWGTQIWEGGPDPYRMWMNGGTSVGGVMELPDQAKQQGAPPHWLAYIATPDVDQTIKDAETRGGRVLSGPMDIPTIGRIAVMADPQGAVFASHTAAGEAPGHDGVPLIGEASWHELATSDPVAAFDFYSRLFGWVKTDAMDMGPAGTYQMYGCSKDHTLGGIFARAADASPSPWLVYFQVESVDAKVDLVTSLGGQVLSGPMDVPPGGDRVVQCLDPQGAAFALHSSATAA